ncbi:IS3 family transposase [Candidatus Stoquefichus sp. SB1]|uniref:IS3 family transposase n=1 Tax=Candidatus Stoquefichus sp. SB1 TaxID=1658109 RepID=UPI0021014BFF|nr:IS3 family transposase [Candidatus Stoquefichus sp. SB1]
MSEEATDKENTLNISLMCRILGVKRANYYKWLQHEKSAVDKENEEIAECIREYHKKYNGLLGCRMMADRINRDYNKNYSDKRIYKIMRILGIHSIIRPERRSCIVRKYNNTARNNLKRDFNASRPNEKWVTDVTEFKYGPHNEYKLYLSAFIEFYDRTVVNYEVGDRNNNTHVFNTFDKTVKDNPQPLFHSDGGFQYTSSVFINMIKAHGMIQSMSRIHCCIDNEPMERFWRIMKCEMYHYGKHYNTKEELIKAIDD